MVPRLQSDKDILGLTSENPDASKVPTGGKRSADSREDEPSITNTCTSSNSSVLVPDAELCFSGQFSQRKRLKRQHKALENSDRETRPMVQDSTLGSAGTSNKGGSSLILSGLAKHVKRAAKPRKGVLQRGETEGKGS